MTFEIFPAAAGGLASFDLYEDDGESLGYLREEWLRTPVTCASVTNGLEIEIGDREGKGYEIAGQRNFILKIYSDKELRKALMDGKAIKKSSAEKILATAESDFEETAVSLDKKNGVYMIRIPDDGKKHKITLYE